MTFKIKNGLQVGGTQALDENGKLTTSLATPRNITINGSVSGSATFDGSQDITITTTGGGGGASITQTNPTYVASGGTTTFSAKSVIAAYEQTAGTTLNVNYTTEADYTQEDPSKTDFTGGTITLSSSGGSGIDTSTKLLLHADGNNGDVKFVDNRGVTSFGSQCGYFDGSSYYTVPTSYKLAVDNVQNFTIEGWFRIDGGNSYRYIFDTLGTIHKRAVIYPDNTLFIAGQGTSTSAVLSNNTWYHFAMVRFGGTVNCYLNGVSFGSFTDTTSYTTSSLTIGGNVSGTERFYGWLDEIRISKVARYTGTFTPHTTPHVSDANTVYLFHFDDGHGGQVLRDDSRSGRTAVIINSASVSTAQAKFGSTSLSTGGDGTVSVGGEGEKSQADLQLGTSDFTIDAQYYLSTTSGTQTLINAGANTQYGLKLQSVSGTLQISLSSNGTSFDVANATSCGTISAGAWTHVAITRNDTSVRVFVNGVITATITVSSGANLWTNVDGRYRFGRTPAGDGNIANGYIDEVRIKRGIAEWTTNFTPPTSAYATDDKTILLLHFEGADGDKVTLDSSESSYGTAQISSSTIPTLTFGSSTSLQNTQTRGGHVTSLYCDNTTNGYVNYNIAANDLIAGHPLRLGSSSDYLCVEGWFYDTGDTDGAIIVLDDTTATVSRFYITKAGATTLQAVYYNGGSVSLTNGTVTNNAWNHFAFVREPRGWVLYMNGTATASPINPAHNITYTTANTHDLWIGKYRASLYPFGGYIDAVRITNGKPRYTANFTPATLTQDADTALLWTFDGIVGQKWVKELSKNTAIIATTNARTVDDGMWINSSTTNPVKLSTNTSKFGTSSLFYTQSQSLTVTKGPWCQFNGDFTIDGWFRIQRLAAAQTIYSQNTASYNGIQLYIDTSNRLHAYASNNGTSWTISIQGSTNLSSATWYHAALVRSGTTWSLYLNGTLEGSTTGSVTMNNFSGNPYIGSWSGTADFFDGYIDELRISDTARWTSNFTPPTSPYGTSYVTGPAYITTTNTSRINMTGYDGVYSCAVTETLNPGSSTRYFVSFDGRTTWKTSTDNGVTWNAYSLSSANLISYGMTASQLQNALVGSNSSVFGQYIDIAAVLQTSNTSYTPVIDNINIGFDQYQTMQLGVDYSIRKNQATGTQTLTFTRLKAGSANHTFDLI